MSVQEIIVKKIENLPHEKQNEVLDFVEFLLQKQASPQQEKGQRVFGSAKGKIHMSDDFDAPLDDFEEYM